MNRYESNPLLIHVKEKEQTMCANYVVVLSMQKAHFNICTFPSKTLQTEDSHSGKKEASQCCTSSWNLYRTGHILRHELRYGTVWLFEWNHLLRYRQIFLEKSDGNKGGKCPFLAWFSKVKVRFVKLLMYEHFSNKKDVWMEFINGIEGMNIVYTLRLHPQHKQSFMPSVPLMNF